MTLPEGPRDTKDTLQLHVVEPDDEETPANEDPRADLERIRKRTTPPTLRGLGSMLRAATRSRVDDVAFDDKKGTA